MRIVKKAPVALAIIAGLFTMNTVMATQPQWSINNVSIPDVSNDTPDGVEVISSSQHASTLNLTKMSDSKLVSAIDKNDILYTLLEKNGVTGIGAYYTSGSRKGKIAGSGFLSFGMKEKATTYTTPIINSQDKVMYIGAGYWDVNKIKHQYNLYKIDIDVDSKKYLTVINAKPVSFEGNEDIHTVLLSGSLLEDGTLIFDGCVHLNDDPRKLFNVAYRYDANLHDLSTKVLRDRYGLMNCRMADDEGMQPSIVDKHTAYLSQSQGMYSIGDDQLTHYNLDTNKFSSISLSDKNKIVKSSTMVRDEQGRLYLVVKNKLDNSNVISRRHRDGTIEPVYTITPDKGGRWMPSYPSIYLVNDTLYVREVNKITALNIYKAPEVNKIWSYSLPEDEYINNKNVIITESGMVYIATNKSVYLLDEHGKKVWKNDFFKENEDRKTNMFTLNNEGSPIVASCLNSDCNIYSFSGTQTLAKGNEKANMPKLGADLQNTGRTYN